MVSEIKIISILISLDETDLSVVQSTFVVKILNALPETIKSHNLEKFSSTLKIFFEENPFFSIKIFRPSKNNLL